MKLYLSSFRLGDCPDKLQLMFGDDKAIAVIGNAVDYYLTIGKVIIKLR